MGASVVFLSQKNYLRRRARRLGAAFLAVLFLRRVVRFLGAAFLRVVRFLGAAFFTVRFLATRFAGLRAAFRFRAMVRFIKLRLTEL